MSNLDFIVVVFCIVGFYLMSRYLIRDAKKFPVALTTRPCPKCWTEMDYVLDLKSYKACEEQELTVAGYLCGKCGEKRFDTTNLQTDVT